MNNPECETYTYKINNMLSRTLIFDNIKIITALVLIFPWYYEWSEGTEFVWERLWGIIFSIGIILMNIIPVSQYINYYLENRNTSFSVDINSNIITITQNGITKAYDTKEITQSNYHLGIFYRAAIDRQLRLPMLNSGFGYWSLKFNNGDHYYLTNILHDFIHDEPPFIRDTKYRFRLLTYIHKADVEKTDDLKPPKEKTRVEQLVEKYATKSDEELNEILKNQKDYQKEAVAAAALVLKNRALVNKG